MGGDESGKLLLQQRRILADGPRDRPVVVDDEIVAHSQARKDFRPNVRLVVVDDRIGDESGAHHLENVVVFEILVDRVNCDRREALGREIRAEAAQVAGIGARGADKRLLARKVAKRGKAGRIGASDDDFLDVPYPGRRKIDQSLPLGRDRQFARDHVAFAFQQIGDQRVARRGQEDHVHSQMALGVFGVEPGFERLSQFGDQPHLPPSVDHVEGLIVGDEETHEPAFRHAVEVTRPGPAQFGHEVQPKGRLTVQSRRRKRSEERDKGDRRRAYRPAKTP